MYDNDIEQIVLDNLSILIIRAARSLKSEQYDPSGNCDSSDQKTEDLKKRVDSLRKIRIEFENAVSGVV